MEEIATSKLWAPPLDPQGPLGPQGPMGPQRPMRPQRPMGPQKGPWVPGPGRQKLQNESTQQKCGCINKRVSILAEKVAKMVSS